MTTRDGRIEQQMDGWIRAARCQKIKRLRGMGIGQTRTLETYLGSLQNQNKIFFMSFLRKVSSSYEIPIVAEASHDAQLKMTKFLFEIHIVCTGRGVLNQGL